MFYLIGLGLGDAKDITVKGLEVVKNAERVYLEAYTSILTVGKEELVGDLLTFGHNGDEIESGDMCNNKGELEEFIWFYIYRCKVHSVYSVLCWHANKSADLAQPHVAF